MLQVLVGTIGDQTSNGDDGIEADTGTSAALSGRSDGSGARSLGSRVTGLFIAIG